MTRPGLISLLEDLEPDEIELYLRGHGWVRQETLGVRAAYWTKGGGELLVPATREIGDYLLRLEDAVAGLADAEGRPVDDLIGELVTPVADVIRLGLESDESRAGTLPIPEAVALFEAAGMVVLAAAAATVEPRREYSSGQPPIANEYLSTVRVGQTQPGSYVVTIIAPLDPRGDWPRPAFGRAVTQTLAGALESISDYVSGQTPVLPAMIRAGVSADMCAALRRGLQGDADHALKFEFRWSQLAPGDPDTLRTLTFDQISEGNLGELERSLAGRQLRAVRDALEAPASYRLEAEDRELPLRVGFTLTGYVTQLSNRSWILVRAPIDGRVRSVHIDLSELDYELAIKAHDQDRPIFCIGDLKDRPRIPLLLNARDFRVTGLVPQ